MESAVSCYLFPQGILPSLERLSASPYAVSPYRDESLFRFVNYGVTYRAPPCPLPSGRKKARSRHVPLDAHHTTPPGTNSDPCMDFFKKNKLSPVQGTLSPCGRGGKGKRAFATQGRGPVQVYGPGVIPQPSHSDKISSSPAAAAAEAAAPCANQNNSARANIFLLPESFTFSVFAVVFCIEAVLKN